VERVLRVVRQRELTACVLVPLALAGCFDFDAAGRCFDAAACVDDTPLCGDLPSRCAELPAALCDGFEDAFLNPYWYVFDNPPSIVAALDRSRACRGTASLAMHLDPAPVGSSPRVRIQETRTEQPVPLVHRWMRAFWFVPSTSLTADFNRLISVVQAGDPFHNIDFGIAAGKLTISNEETTTANPTYSTTPLPTDRWTCIVVEILHDSPGEIRVWLDDVAVPDLQLTQQTAASPPFGDMMFGPNLYQIMTATGAIDIWLDEIVVDSAPLACAH
jgi:hypothetical protein